MVYFLIRKARFAILVISRKSSVGLIKLTSIDLAYGVLNANPICCYPNQNMNNYLNIPLKKCMSILMKTNRLVVGGIQKNIHSDNLTISSRNVSH